MAGEKTAIMKVEELGVEINKEFILNNVLLCVESYDAEARDGIIYGETLDLRTYYRLLIDDERSLKITEKFINAYDINVMELHESACKNVREKLMIQNLGSFLFGQADPIGPDIVSNTDMRFGSGIISFRDVFSELCRKHNVNHCYILPSSIHEILVHYPLGCETKEDFDYMVQSVNKQEVLPEERLADHCYVYRLGSDTLEY